MDRTLRTIDISSLPDVVQLVEEVQRTHVPRVLRHNGKDMAIIAPLVQRADDSPQGKTRRQPTQADWEAFRAAAGAWSDVDTDQLLTDIYKSRRISTRPPVEL